MTRTALCKMSPHDLDNRPLVRPLRRDPDKADTDHHCTCTPFVRATIKTLTPIRRHYYLLQAVQLSYGLSTRIARGFDLRPAHPAEPSPAVRIEG